CARPPVGVGAQTVRSAADGASPIRNDEGRWVIAHRPSSCVNWPQPYPGAVEPASNQLPTRTGTGLSPVGPQAQRGLKPGPASAVRSSRADAARTETCFDDQDC